MQAMLPLPPPLRKPAAEAHCAKRYLSQSGSNSAELQVNLQFRMQQTTDRLKARRWWGGGADQGASRPAAWEKLMGWKNEWGVCMCPQHALPCMEACRSCVHPPAAEARAVHPSQGYSTLPPSWGWSRGLAARRWSRNPGGSSFRSPAPAAAALGGRPRRFLGAAPLLLPLGSIFSAPSSSCCTAWVSSSSDESAAGVRGGGGGGSMLEDDGSMSESGASTTEPQG